MIQTENVTMLLCVPSAGSKIRQAQPHRRRRARVCSSGSVVVRAVRWQVAAAGPECGCARRLGAACGRTGWAVRSHGAQEWKIV